MVSCGFIGTFYVEIRLFKDDVMPQIEPFRGILYNSKKVNISTVVAPPYDVISPEMQDELYLRAECNIVRLILGKEEPSDTSVIPAPAKAGKAGIQKLNNKYKRAKRFFDLWIRKNILIQDRLPSLYIYSQEYRYENKKKTRLGFIARMKIEDPATSRVLPHEYTFSKPKQDRLNLIREVNANLCAIFTLFQDDGKRVEKILKTVLRRKPIFDLEYEKVRHRLWRLNNRALIRAVQSAMRDKEIYIADGHHRYEVALLYRDEMRKKDHRLQTAGRRQKPKGYDYVMMYFAPMKEEGLTILSTHRVVKNIYMDIEDFISRAGDYFYVKEIGSIKQLLKRMSSAKKGEYVFGLYLKNKKFYLLKLKNEDILDNIIKGNKSREWKRLDVSILHSVIFNHILHLKEKIQDEDNIIYTRELDFAKKEVDKEGYDAAFFLNPTKVSQVQDLARRGDRMPHKSTYFYPKLLSGLVINKIC